MNSKPTRHKWLENPKDEDPAAFADTYKVSKCSRCKLLRLHQYAGGVFAKRYLAKGRLTNTLPPCNPE